MKKILILLLLLSIPTFVFATPISKPYLSQYSERLSVYNASAVQLLTGAVVVWTHTAANSTYSAVTTTTDTTAGYKFAGIVESTIDTGSVGYIIVEGWAEVKIKAAQSDTTTVGGLRLVPGSTAQTAQLMDTTDTGFWRYAPIGFTYEAIASDAATTITCKIRKGF